MNKGHKGRGSVGRSIRAIEKRLEYAKAGLCRSCGREKGGEEYRLCNKCRDYMKRWKLKNG